MTDRSPERPIGHDAGLGWVTAVVLGAALVLPLGVLVAWILTPAGAVVECDSASDACDSHLEFLYFAPPAVFLAIAIAGRTWRWYWGAVAIAMGAALIAGFAQTID